MGANKERRRTNPVILGLMAACVLAAAVLIALLVWDPTPKAPPEKPVPTEEIQAAPVVLPVTADADPDSLRCKDTYLVAAEDFDPDTTVARLADETLTAGQLQAYYWLEVCGYTGQPAPDLTKPLEEQPCPLTQEGLSWQHYFLRRAIEAWQLEQGLVLAAREPMPVTEALFQPNEENHETYFPAGIPAEKVLYADRDCFTPNSVHQAYLDSLPEVLSRLAADAGAESIGALAGTRDSDVAAAAERLNLAYMFFTETTWEEAKEASIDEDTVSLRHCLLIPDTKEEADWAACKVRAGSLLKNWKNHWLSTRNGDSHFARLANENSMDQGTRADGGLLTGIRRGQLLPTLEDWCFDDARQPGDTAVLQSELGVHIVYFRGRQTQAAAEEGDAAFRDRADGLLARAASYGKADVDYSAVILAPMTPAEVSYDSLLYPDVGFQRFPEVPLYLQQDYGNLRFGDQYLSVAGCGMCSMAMLSTYMTDTVYTPAMVVKLFPYYYGQVGTDGNLFLYGPADLGFYSDGQVRTWEDILAKLEQAPIVTLQIHGVFTTGGHFMVLSRGHEDGTVTVRDSNLKNYSRLSGFQTDRFTREAVLSGGTLFYAFQPKLVTLAGCSRCGEGSDTARDYLCPKCAAALTRREAFLALTADSGK